MIASRIFLLVLASLPAFGDDEWKNDVTRAAQLAETGRLADAVEVLKQVVADPRVASTPPEFHATLWNNLAVVLHDLSRYDEAEAAYAKAIALIEKGFGATDLRLLQPLMNTAAMHLNRERFSDADRLLKRVEEILGAGGVVDPRLRIKCLILRGGVLGGARRLPEAEAALRTALDEARKLPVPDMDLSTILNNLAVVQMKQGRSAEARAHVEEAVTLMERAEGPLSTLLIRPLINLADIASEMRRHDHAAALFERALRVADNAAGLSPDVRADLLERYERVLKKVGRKEEAREVAVRLKSMAPVHRDRRTVDVMTLRGRQ